jgi:hypothetical protein
MLSSVTLTLGIHVGGKEYFWASFSITPKSIGESALLSFDCTTIQDAPDPSGRSLLRTRGLIDSAPNVLNRTFNSEVHKNLAI